MPRQPLSHLPRRWRGVGMRSRCTTAAAPPAATKASAGLHCLVESQPLVISISGIAAIGSLGTSAKPGAGFFGCTIRPAIWQNLAMCGGSLGIVRY